MSSAPATRGHRGPDAPSGAAGAKVAGAVYRLPSILPLDNFTVRQIERIEQLVGASRWLGWGREESGAFFADVLDSDGEVQRYTGGGLKAALGAALRALAPAPAEDAP